MFKYMMDNLPNSGGKICTISAKKFYATVKVKKSLKHQSQQFRLRFGVATLP